ncbi:zinc finger BED domain-containing protein 1-like [Rhagoletis pomonella]|uniref:zinc finger BED domain-containing protein 1-like n=1 Tax=Rhagoletis pomonella TaxID=28610 RepID=UPI00177ADDE9|nr:zinc finger BED domain-containing protein 1-like [Rhagoletis pomonella]
MRLTFNICDPSGDSRYRKKSEKFFRTTLMPATYDKIKHKVTYLIANAEWISFTTDIWSNSTKSCSLLSFTAHFLEGPRRLKVILAASVLETDHTAQNIFADLNKVIEEYNIRSKIHLAVTDNAANMRAAMKLGNIKWFGCTAHTGKIFKIYHTNAEKLWDILREVSRHVAT